MGSGELTDGVRSGPRAAIYVENARRPPTRGIPRHAARAGYQAGVVGVDTLCEVLLVSLLGQVVGPTPAESHALHGHRGSRVPVSVVNGDQG